TLGLLRLSWPSKADTRPPACPCDHPAAVADERTPARPVVSRAPLETGGGDRGRFTQRFANHRLLPPPHTAGGPVGDRGKNGSGRPLEAEPGAVTKLTRTGISHFARERPKRRGRHRMHIVEVRRVGRDLAGPMGRMR